MSINFPISLAGKRGGIDLKEGLVHWWEDGDRFDKVSGTAKLGGLRGTKTLAPPAPFVDTFDPSRDAGSITSHMNNPATDFTSYTVFMLAGRKATNGYRSLFSSDGYNKGDEMVENSSNRIATRANSSSFGYANHTNQQWNTFVYSKDGDTASLYKDGVLIMTRSGSYTSSYWWRVWDCQKTAFAIWGRANIPWTQEHVDAFHNGGNYVQYADL